MDSTVITALISSASSVLIAGIALTLNYRGFTSLDSRMLALESHVIDLGNIRTEMAEMRGELKLDIQRIENKLDHLAEVQASHSEKLSKLS